MSLLFAENKKKLRSGCCAPIYGGPNRGCSVCLWAICGKTRLFVFQRGLQKIGGAKFSRENLWFQQNDGGDKGFCVGELLQIFPVALLLSGEVRNMKLTQRASGVLLHITSLPSDFGIGDLGPWSYRFADFCRGEPALLEHSSPHAHKPQIRQLPLSSNLSLCRKHASNKPRTSLQRRLAVRKRR